jgi:hypothetical protein
MLVRMRKKSDSFIAGGVKNGLATVKDSLVISLKKKKN